MEISVERSGRGGAAPGIVLHQVLQWHNMGSAVLPPSTMAVMKQNMVWDGLFHAGTWLITFAGVWMLWSRARRGGILPSGRAFLGQMILGWGAFNLAEGLMTIICSTCTTYATCPPTSQPTISSSSRSAASASSCSAGSSRGPGE